MKKRDKFGFSTLPLFAVLFGAASNSARVRLEDDIEAAPPGCRYAFCRLSSGCACQCTKCERECHTVEAA